MRMAVAIRSFLLPVLALLVGIAAVVYSALLYDESRTVQQHGLLAPVQSVINEKKVKRSDDRVTFRADITFTRQDGKAATAKGAISDVALDGFRNGRPLQVAYLPDRPDVIRVVGEEDEGSSWLLVIVGVVASAYGGFGLFRASKRR